MAAARALARERRGKHPPIPRQHHPATPSSAGSMTPGGGIEPPQRQPAPGNSPYQHRRRLTERCEAETRRQKSPVSVIRQHPAGGSNPREGNQPRVHQIQIPTRHQTRPIDRPIDRQTHTERTCLVDWRLSGLLELAGASQFGPCAGCVGGRDGSRPSRPPHGHARCFGGGQSRRRGLPCAPARPRRSSTV